MQVGCGRGAGDAGCPSHHMPRTHSFPFPSFLHFPKEQGEEREEGEGNLRGTTRQRLGGKERGAPGTRTASPCGLEVP